MRRNKVEFRVRDERRKDSGITRREKIEFKGREERRLDSGDLRDLRNRKQRES